MKHDLLVIKKDVHQLWNQTFENTPVMNTKLIISNRISQNGTKTLVHRRPHYKSVSIPTDKTNQNYSAPQLQCTSISFPPYVFLIKNYFSSLFSQ
jgi:hypothetical protein